VLAAQAGKGSRHTQADQNGHQQYADSEKLPSPDTPGNRADNGSSGRIRLRTWYI
jgi:hypothetical protein